MHPSTRNQKDMLSKGVTFLPPWDGSQRDPEVITALKGLVSKHAHRARYRGDVQRERMYHPRTWMCMCSSCQLEASLTDNIIAYCGNSDPFDSLCIHLDAMANLYLAFGRGCVQSLVQGMEPPAPVELPSQAQLRTGRGSETLTKIWSPVISTKKTADGNHVVSIGGQLELHSLDMAPPGWAATHTNAILAYCANALYAITGSVEHQVHATTYTVRAIKGLRNQLQQGDIASRLRAEELVYRLAQADFILKHFDSARIHACYLQQLLRQNAWAGKLDVKALTMAMHVDNNIALQSASRPVFDSVWPQQVLSSYWSRTDKLFSPKASYDIGYTAPNTKLQVLLTAGNKLLRQSHLFRGYATALNDGRGWQCFASQREWLTNCLLNEILDYQGAEATTSSILDALFARCLVLTMILALRIQKWVFRIGHSALKGVGIGVTDSIEASLRAIDSATEPWFSLHLEPLIWISFICALQEHKLRAYYPALQQPCVARLHRYVKLAGLRDWPTMQALLRKFPYTDSEMPLPYETWLDEAFQ